MPSLMRCCRDLQAAWSAVVVMFVLLLTLGAGSAAAVEKRMALVIGNARYPALPLNNPESDARVVAATLRRLGFEVKEHVNLPVKEFRRVLRDYAKSLQNEEGASVFYYAGHGVQIDGRNYLLPIDINLRDEEEVKDEAVDVDELFVSRLERARTQVRIVILDACRDNPFGAKTRNLRSVGGLAEMAARGALIAYSSAPGAAAEDGPPGTNSVYTRHLVKEMLTEGIEVEQMFKNVRVKVLRDTSQRQIPWVNTSLTANFSFNPRPSGPPAEEASKREDLGRLQALLDSREREQKKLEEELKRMSKRLQQAEAEAGRIPLVPKESIRYPATTAGPSGLALSLPQPAAKPSATPASSTVVPTVAAAPRKQILPITEAPVVPAPSVAPAPAVNAAAKPRAPASSAVAARSEHAKPPAERPAKAKPASPPEARVALSPSARPADASGRANSERCVALLIRAQLGEAMGSADTTYLHKECR
jgi:uncharacterized caspase-like protein